MSNKPIVSGYVSRVIINSDVKLDLKIKDTMGPGKLGFGYTFAQGVSKTGDLHSHPIKLEDLFLTFSINNSTLDGFTKTLTYTEFKNGYDEDSGTLSIRVQKSQNDTFIFTAQKSNN